MKKQFSLNKWLMAGVAALVTTATYAANNAAPATKDQGPMAYTYPKDIGLVDPSDFYAFGDYLLMQAKEDGLEFAISTEEAGGSNYPIANGELHGLSSGSHMWNWTSGLRVGAGFYFDYDNWNLEAKWTYFHIKNDKSSPYQGSVEYQLVPIWLAPHFDETGFQCHYASERWKGDYNTFDLALGKPFHPSKHFVLNPYFAIRAAWIDQHLTARYSGYFDLVTTKVVMRGNSDYWGIGGKVGLEGQYLLGSNFYLFGNGMYSLLYSKFDITQANDLETYYSHLDTDFYTTTPNFELALGGSWGCFLSNKKYFLSFKAAYEFIYWFNMNQLRKGTCYDYVGANISERGDLSFSGFSFRVQADF